MASDDEEREAATAKMGGKVGRVDWRTCDWVSRRRRSERGALRAHLHHSDSSPASRSTPIPLDELAPDSADSEQSNAFSLQPADLAVCAFDIAFVQIKVGLRKRCLVGEDEVRQQSRRLARVALLGQRES